MTHLRSLFLALAVAWVILLPAASYAAGGPPGEWAGGYAVALAVYRVAGLICHQRPERSFVLFGAQLPVCARCAGIYAGAAVTAIAVWASVRGPLPPTLARRVLLAMAVPTALTLLFEWTTGRMPTHWIRAASGAPLGGAVVWIVARSWPRRGG